MIDPITQLILEDEMLDHILEGYDLKCGECGRVISIVKDGKGPLECCSRRMFVMGSHAEPEDVEPMEEKRSLGPVRRALKGQVVKPDFQVKTSDVDFGPYNQVDAEKKIRDKWEKEDPYMESGLLGDIQYYYGEQKPKKKLAEAGFETKPKGWTDKSVKKYGRSLVKGGGREKGFFKKCVEKMKDKMENPEGFCASVKDEAWDSTYWRGKKKSEYETQKKTKAHKNV